MELMRNRGHGGGAIPLHRALTTLRAAPRDIAAALGIGLVLTGGWLCMLDAVCSLWARILEFGCWALGLDAEVVVVPSHFGALLAYGTPYPMLAGGAPSPLTWWITMLATLGLVVLSFPLAKRHLPAAYGVRALAAIQMSALLFFALWPEAFPCSLAEYIGDSLTANLVLISSVPLLLGFTYNVFGFHWLQKLALTLLAVLHLSLFVPLQYLLHAYLLHHFSLLFMPLFALALGLPLNGWILVAFYSWGMSWEAWTPRRRRPSPAVPDGLPEISPQPQPAGVG
jgi:hypothetical protein